MAERSVIRELVTLLGFDIDEKTIKTYELRIAEARKNLRRFAITAGIATAAVAAIARKTAVAGDNLVKTSNRLGLSVKALQEWRFVAERSGVQAATFDMAMQRFGRRAAEAARGTGEAVKALARLRVQTKDANGQVRSMDELLEDALAALAQLESPLERNALAMKLFDSEGVRVVQMLQGGAEGIEQLRKRFRSLGAGISDATAQLGVEAVDAWTDFAAAMNGVIFAMGEQLLPLVTDLLNFLAEWIAENRELVTTITWITLAVTALTAVVFAGLAVWKIWAAAIAIINVGLVLMLAKVTAIVAFFGLIALLAEDIALFFTGRDVDTLTGRLVTGIRGVFKTIWEWIVGLAMHLINMTMPVAIQDMLMGVIEWLRDRLILEFKALGAAVRSLFPQEVLDAIDWLTGASDERRDPLEGKPRLFGPGGALERRRQTLFGEGGVFEDPAQRGSRSMRLFGSQGTFSALERPRTQPNVQITVNQLPGETGGGVAERVAQKVLGKGVTVPLIGLGVE